MGDLASGQSPAPGGECRTPGTYQGMKEMRIDRDRAIRTAALAALVLVAITFLPDLLRNPEPPAIPADVGFTPGTPGSGASAVGPLPGGRPGERNVARRTAVDGPGKVRRARTRGRRKEKRGRDAKGASRHKRKSAGRKSGSPGGSAAPSPGAPAGPAATPPAPATHPAPATPPSSAGPPSGTPPSGSAPAAETGTSSPPPAINSPAPRPNPPSPADGSQEFAPR